MRQSSSVERVVVKNRIKGTVSVPSSKSLLQRYMIAAFLAGGETALDVVHHCEDSLSCLEAIRLLGAKIQTGDGDASLLISGCNGLVNPLAGSISCGESGFALRALIPVAALSIQHILLTATGSLQQRPIHFQENVFRQLQVEGKTLNGFPPVSLKGPLRFRDIAVDGSLSSQLLTGLLMVFPLAPEDHIIEVRDLKSRQYVDLTMRVMTEFGVSIRHEAYRKFFIPGSQVYKPCKVKVEGDWSAAAMMLVAGATAGEVTVNNVSRNSLQPDKAIVELLKHCGAKISQEDNSITAAAARLKSFQFDATDCPDLFPPLAALAVRCNGVSEITGVERLIHKESNRALSLQREFSKMNDNVISVEGNKMFVRGGLPLKSVLVDSHNDHRIAMALAVAGLNIEGGITIRRAESVEKSYLEFFSDLELLTL